MRGKDYIFTFHDRGIGKRPGTFYFKYLNTINLNCSKLLNT